LRGGQHGGEKKEKKRRGEESLLHDLEETRNSKKEVVAKEN